EEHFQFAGQHIAFSLGEGLQIEPQTNGGDEFSHPTPVSASPNEQAYSWSKGVALPRWVLRPSTAGEVAAIQVSRAWLQTWLAPPVRQERVAFRLNTSQTSLRVRL